MCLFLEILYYQDLEIQCKSPGWGFLPPKETWFLIPVWEKDLSSSDTFLWICYIETFIHLIQIIKNRCYSSAALLLTAKKCSYFNVCSSSCRTSRVSFALNLWIHKNVRKLGLSGSDSQLNKEEVSWLSKLWKLFTCVLSKCAHECYLHLLWKYLRKLVTCYRR